jgi:hypothetical protein
LYLQGHNCEHWGHDGEVDKLCIPVSSVIQQLISYFYYQWYISVPLSVLSQFILRKNHPQLGPVSGHEIDILRLVVSWTRYLSLKKQKQYIPFSFCHYYSCRSTLHRVMPTGKERYSVITNHLFILFILLFFEPKVLVVSIYIL